MNRQSLEDIRGYAAARRIRVTDKAQQHMSQHGVTYDDLRYGLMSASTMESGGSTFRVETLRRTEGPLTMIITRQDGIVVLEVR